LVKGGLSVMNDLFLITLLLIVLIIAIILIAKIIREELRNPSTEQEIMIIYLGLIIILVLPVILGLLQAI